MKNRRLVIFDVDGTLIPRPGCEPRFARYLLARGRLGPHQMAACGTFWLRYGAVFGRATPQKNKAWLAGLECRTVAGWAAEYVREQLVPLVAPLVLARLREHMAAGDYVVLLSGTPNFIVAPLAAELGARQGYGAVCAARDGRFLARPPPRHPYGPSKVVAARALAHAADLALEQAIAYGDSIADAHLFRAVGHSVAVMPDRRLRAAARIEDWEVLGG